MPRAPLKLGLSGGLLPTDVTAFDDTSAAAVAALGFAGLTLHLGGAGTITDPEGFDEALCERIRETAARHGLAIVHSWGFGANLCDPSDEDRAAQLRRLAGALRVAAALGAEGVITGAGSCDPLGGYRPHRENHGARTEDRLVASLSELAPEAEALDVSIALEGHVLTVLDTPERTRRVIDRVGSTAVRANIDPVNFVSGVDDLFGSRALVDRALDALGDMAAAGHVKDVAIGDEFVLRLDEVPLGRGDFDVPYFVGRFAALVPESWLFIEHLAAEDVPEAKRRLDAMVGGAEA